MFILVRWLTGYDVDPRLETLAVTAITTLVAVSLGMAAYQRFVKPRYDFHQKHVLVTGGTKGLGLALSQLLAVNYQAQVTVCARTESDVVATTKAIRDSFSADHFGRIQGIVCDVTNTAQVEKMINSAEGAFGPVDVLICCAGQALPGNFINQSYEDFKRQIDLNYLGSLLPAHTVVKRMVERKQKQAKIVFVASQAALMSMTGYAAYSPSKFAVRGLAEALRHELLPYGIDVHIAFPGNMNSPGYEIEQKTKPAVTKKVEAMEPLQEPVDVAKATLDSLSKGEFAIYGGNFSGYFLGRMSRGLAPYGTHLLVDMLLAPVLVAYAFVHRKFILDPAHA
jgi:NAD(P)-dependent dehydrogenase (short-subunit alcohol dehydrogenase family)